MRGITTTFAAAILTLGTAVAVAAPALATEGEFLNDLRNDGFTGSDPVLLDWGYRICDDWQDGINRDKIIENVYQNTDESITRDDAKFVFESATMFLC
jgi:uncharacterized protein DUF732